jgi:hypothetical protein
MLMDSGIKNKIRSALFKMKSPEVPFTCPYWRNSDEKFHTVCPACGRPCIRDYIDSQMHPMDPNPAGIYSGRFWARVVLVLTLTGIILYLLYSFGIGK